MEKNVWYKVTKEGDDGTLQVGDTIKLCDDGCLLCIEAVGFIYAVSVDDAMKGVELEVDKGFIELRKKDLEAELELLKKLASGGDNAKTS